MAKREGESGSMTRSQKNAEAEAIARQTKAEHNAFHCLQTALEGILEWRTEGSTFTRKLSCLRFLFRSFHDFLERIMDIEEYDGYMNIAAEEYPELNDRIETLQKEHLAFRETAGEIATTLERLVPDDHVALTKITQDVRSLIKKLDEHSKRETELIFDAMLSENGVGD